MDNTDELNAQFGRLSTSAAEWKPGGTAAPSSSSATEQQYPSDLNASKVKEFVPGLGWAAGTSDAGRSGEKCFCLSFARHHNLFVKI
mmetsp:Transcript_11082/g.22704  ORF Transcript_11082/g.22704 Transcript_11082/m.22704 type:complete len:87 (-) Transcript_11082:1553-1813(-)